MKNNEVLDQFMRSIGRSLKDLQTPEDAYAVVDIYNEKDFDRIATNFGLTSGAELKIALEDAIADFFNQQTYTPPKNLDPAEVNPTDDKNPMEDTTPIIFNPNEQPENNYNQVEERLNAQINEMNEEQKRAFAVAIDK